MAASAARGGIGALLLLVLVLAGCTSSTEPLGGSGFVPTFPGGDGGSGGQGGSKLPAAAQGPWPPPAGTKLFKTEVFLENLSKPVNLLSARDGTGRLFVVEKTGTVRVVKEGRLLEEPFIDLTGQVALQNEQGLFSIAFPPDFPRSGRVYAHYTNLDGDTRVVRYTVDKANPDRVDPASKHEILSLDQPFEMHNGGQLAFGPDGMLYIALGDGGSDPARAQDMAQLFGKILRIDVSGPEGYRVPPDNPFVGRQFVKGETWAVGFRNPFHFSFDRATGDIYVGDVGFDSREELDRIPAGQGGLNFGWHAWEGTVRASDFEPPGEEVFPIYEYGHDEGCAVMGGYVYRGSAIPNLYGTYVYGDFCNGRIGGLRQAADGTWVNAFLMKAPGLLTGFGEDDAGEMYTLHHYKGWVLKLVPP